MFVAGAYITISEGAGAMTGLAWDIPLPLDLRYGEANSPWEVRQKIRELAHRGADHIKILSTGAVGGTLYFMPREQITHFRLLNELRRRSRQPEVVPDPEGRWRVDLSQARWKDSDEPLMDGIGTQEPVKLAGEGGFRSNSRLGDLRREPIGAILGAAKNQNLIIVGAAQEFFEQRLLLADIDRI